MATEDFEALLKANSESYIKERQLVDRAQQDYAVAENEVERALLAAYIEKQSAVVDKIKKAEVDIKARKATADALDKFPYLKADEYKM